MAAAFGRPVGEVFSFLSPAPVAAASLGQVYRATLCPELGGADVAVKVQRPGVLRAVALDLYIMRRAAVAVSALPEVSTDWAALIDAWAVRCAGAMGGAGARFAARFAAFFVGGSCASAGPMGAVSPLCGHRHARLTPSPRAPPPPGSFLHEMDYSREAQNALDWEAQMQAAGVDGVTIAHPVPALCSGTVLTTEWIEGGLSLLGRAPCILE
jgi:hypothetical protein